MEIKDKPFKIGLCMAGAVSAGAYTAGVLDYLLEALNEWEKRRGQDNVPNHQVTIPIMGGASAGGMTAILAASTINNNIVPVDLPASENLFDEHPENKLYHSWVDLIGRDMFSKMLDTSDIRNGKIISALNSQFIDDIANKMISSTTQNRRVTPSYFQGSVKVFTTLTNLKGFNYYAGLNSGRRKDKYYMSIHNDYACFEVLDGIKKPEGGAWMPLNFITGENLQTAKNAAMATGAFPIGLAPRILEREAKYVEKIPWLDYVFRNTPLDKEIIRTLNVDGGMINNEPFEKVRDIFNDEMADEMNLPYTTIEEKVRTFQTLENINSDCDTFENTILMIDPFPSVQNENFKMDTDITDIIPKTLSAMLSQMRAKPTDYKDAMKENDTSQFIISPSRQIRDEAGNVIEELFGEKAIACGTLGGFGGFLNKEFRIHDYYLGRYNCEVFLRDYFTIPESALQNNEIFRKGYFQVDKSLYASDETKPGEEKKYQIIPIFTSRPAPGTLKVPKFSCGENWPKITEKDIEKFNKPLKKRVEKILMNVVELNGITRPLLYIGAKVVLNKMLAGKVSEAIKKSLNEWRLIESK